MLGEVHRCASVVTRTVRQALFRLISDLTDPIDRRSDERGGRLGRRRAPASGCPRGGVVDGLGASWDGGTHDAPCLA